MKRASGWLMPLLALCVIAATPVPSAVGWIGGRVNNGTAGADGVAGAVVRLVPFTEAGAGDAVSTTLAASGEFEFRELAVGSATEYGLVVTYAGVDYIHADVVTPLAQPGVEPAAMITVYETGSEVPLEVRTGHVVVEPTPEGGQLRVTEVWVVGNNSDRTRVSDGESGVLQLELPPAAHSIGLRDPRDNASAVVSGSSLIVHEPVSPGERDIVLTYMLPYTGSSARYVQTAPLDAAQVRLMLVSPGASVESDALTDIELVEMGGETVVSASGGAFAAGETIVANLGGLPVPTGNAQAATPGAVASSSALNWLPALGLALALLGVLLSFSLGWWSWPPLEKRRRKMVDEQLNQRIVELAALERQRLAGSADDETLAKRRAELLEQAVALKRAADETGGQMP